MNSRKMLAFIGILVTASMILAACGGGGGASTGAPVTLRVNWGTEPPTLDPALATDTTSVGIANNLFSGLTQFNPITGAVEADLATSWEASNDGLTYTFTLREDLAWVTYDSATGAVTQVTDADGNPRFVTAFDVEYGAKRTIDPETASSYAYVMYVIKNAAAVNEGAEGMTTDDLGIKALDATTIEFNLEYAAGYFPSIAAMWTTWPTPQWTIEEHGESWIEAGNIVTNGPYVLDTWIHGDQLVLVKNPLWTGAEGVQIDRIEGVMITEASTSFALYENDELDLTGVPLAEMDRVQADAVLSQEYRSAPTPCTYYYGFNNQKYPTSDRDVRAAFSQAIDRQALSDNVLKGGQLPATSFAPPGMFGAPAPGEVGLGYDPSAAQDALQSFLDREGMTIDEFNALGVTLMHNTSEGHARIAAAIQQMWLDVLGVEVSVENQEWTVYLTTIGKTTPIEEAPHIFRLGWCADYPDENNWVHEVFNSEAGANRTRRNCNDPNCESAGSSKFDELTVEAALESDPAKRIELYREAEMILSEEEAAIAFIYHYTSVSVTKQWLTRNFPAMGGADYWNWKIDIETRGF